jgi:hypothetical protein
MDKRIFYLHEDEWGMITIIPAENLVRSKEIAQEAEEFGKAHFDGFGWTDMYVIPEEKYPLSTRQIPFYELYDLLSELLVPADIVQTGYSSYRESLKYGFAFGEPDGELGAFYREQKDDLVITLHCIPCGTQDVEKVEAFTKILTTHGTRYNLILADWWRKRIINLQDRYEVTHYLQGA